MQNEYTFEQTDVDQAAAQEETERLVAENDYLKQRVVKLRALVNQLEGKVSELTPEVDTEPGEGIEPTE